MGQKQICKKISGALYQVDKENKVINDTPIVATVGKNSYSVTGLQDGEYIQSISVRAGDGKKWSAWSSSKTSKKVSLPAVKGVTAKNVTVKEADGTSSKQVQISWRHCREQIINKVYVPWNRHFKSSVGLQSLYQYQLQRDESDRKGKQPG